MAAIGVPNLRQALAEIVALGGSTEIKYRTGELRVVFGDASVIVNSRRKDTPRSLLSLLVRARRARRVAH